MKILLERILPSVTSANRVLWHYNDIYYLMEGNSLLLPLVMTCFGCFTPSECILYTLHTSIYTRQSETCGRERKIQKMTKRREKGKLTLTWYICPRNGNTDLLRKQSLLSSIFNLFETFLSTSIRHGIYDYNITLFQEFLISTRLLLAFLTDLHARKFLGYVEYRFARSSLFSLLVWFPSSFCWAKSMFSNGVWK